MDEPNDGNRIVRIVVADDRGEMRKLLRSSLEFADDLVVVGEAGNGVEALDLIERLQPDLAVLDVRMPEKDGIETTRDITSRFPNVRVIAVSIHADPLLIKAMKHAGAKAYILKGSPSEILRDAARTVAAGNEFVHKPEDARANPGLAEFASTHSSNRFEIDPGVVG